MHTYLRAIHSLVQPGQQAYECARSYFIGNRGHDLNSMPKNKGEQVRGWRDMARYSGTSFCKIIEIAQLKWPGLNGGTRQW